MTILGRIFGVITDLASPLNVAYGGTGRTSSDYLGQLTLSTSQTLVAAASGAIYTLLGSISLTLPAVSSASATAPIFFYFNKSDGVGASLLKCAGSDTFSNGLTQVYMYQESLTLVSFGGPWAFINRQRGWIPIIAGASITSGSTSAIFTDGFSDPEMSEIELVHENLIPSASATLAAQVTKNSVLVTTGTYITEYLANTALATATASGSTTSTQLTLAAVAAGQGFSGVTNVRNPTNSVGIDSPVQWRGGSSAAGYGLIHGIGYETGAHPITALNYKFSTGTISSGIFRTRGFR